MEPEQFQQILDMVGAAGEGAFTLAVLWIIAGPIKTLISGLVWLATIYLIGRIVQWVVTGAFASVRGFEEVAATLGVSLTQRGYRDQDDVTAVLKKIHEAIQ